MRTNIFAYVLSSENRIKIVQTIFEYPRRQWSCSDLEDLAKTPHATVFRTLTALRDFGILKSVKINKKDILYTLAENSPLAKELKKLLNIGQKSYLNVARNFARKIKSSKIYSVIAYGSIIKNEMMPYSDIDILIVLYKHDKLLESNISSIAATLSVEINKTLSLAFMDLNEIKKEKSSQFIKSVKNSMEIIYGKNQF